MPYYRKLEVDDKLYDYNIGKVFVKIKSEIGSELVKKSDIGIGIGANRYIITPKMIRAYILGLTSNSPEYLSEYFPTCRCVGVDKTLGVIPFDAEIFDKSHYVYWCKSCFEGNADDI